MDRTSENPQAQVTFFVPDNRKSASVHMTVTGYVRRVDDYNREIVFIDGLTVKIDDVWNITIIWN